MLRDEENKYWQYLEDFSLEIERMIKFIQKQRIKVDDEREKLSKTDEK